MRLVDPRFSRRLRELRRRRGLSLTALSTHAHVSTSHLSRLENGQREPTADLAAALDRALTAGGALADLVTEHTTDPETDARATHALTKPGAHIDAGAADALGAILANFRRLDDVQAPAALLPVVQPFHAQLQTLARDGRGPAAAQIHAAAAESLQFLGWLNAQLSRHAVADGLYAASAERAESVGAAGLASQSRRFRGSLARERGNGRAMVRYYQHAAATPGAGILHQIDAQLRTAHGLAILGDVPDARRTLLDASDLTTSADGAIPDQFAYWLTPGWLRFPLGLAHLELGQHAAAADSLRAGLATLPAEHRHVSWTTQFHRALEKADAAT